MANYEERLIIPITPTEEIPLYTVEGTLVAKNYNRIVIGGRGPYVEVEDTQINTEAMVVPEEQAWRENSTTCFYLWYEIDNVKIYYQLKTVDYADYIVGKLYINPFELYSSEGEVLIEKLKKEGK